MWTFCISEMNLFLLLVSSMHSLFLLLSGLGIFFVVERRKNNDSFGFTESLRSFTPRQIRKFIMCAPAEVVKRGRKYLSFIFIHEALEGDGKGDWRLEEQAHSVSLCRHIRSGWQVPLPLLMCIQGHAKPSTCALHY